MTPTDPAIAAAVFAAEHLARNHLAYVVARTRRDLGLRTPPLRDRRGRFVGRAS